MHTLALGPCVPLESFRFNRLIASIFAYYNGENNRYNRFIKAYRKATVIVIKSIKINDYNKRVLIASFVNSETND